MQRRRKLRLMKAIFIDAGHGLGADGKVPDNGAQGIVSERKEVVEIAKEVIMMLQRQPWIGDYKVFSIGVDTPISLDAQVKEVNRICTIEEYSMTDAVLVSIHCNKATGNASGVETWYEGGNTRSRELADKVQQKLCKETSLPNRGLASDLTNGHGRLAIVRDVIPTACLVECGFVDNPTDAGFLKDPLQDDKFARGIVSGLAEILYETFVPIFLDGIFADVEKDRWSANAIKFVKEKGLMLGDGNMFRPTDPITREEFAMVLQRFHDLP